MFPVFPFFGFISIQAQGLLLALGLLAALYTAERLAACVRVRPDHVWSAAAYGLFAVFVGERLPLFLHGWRGYLAHPTWAVALLSVRDGRLFFLGALIGVLVCTGTLLLYRVSLPRAARALLPAAGLLLAFVHAGYFAVGAEPGRVTRAHWGVVNTSRVAHALYGTPLDVRLIPVAAIASIGFAIIALVASVLAVRGRANAGVFLLSAGVLTVVLEQLTLRWPGEPLVAGLFSWPQAAGIASILLGAILLLRTR